ncbi:MAG: hypothetical protein LC722_04510 [Actinobacteria bacterium]|nr:hypothetical protein [Actinomycetota bacterium]
MNYAQAVGRGRKLLTESEAHQWQLAELTTKVIEEGARGIVMRWAEDLGVSHSHVSNLRSVWTKFGNRYRGNELDGLTFNECYTFARSSSERSERIKRVADETGTSPTTADRNDHARRRTRLQDAREVLEDQEVVDQVLHDPKLRERLERALRRTREETHPDVPSLSERRWEREVIEDLREMEQRLHEIEEQLPEHTLQPNARKTVVGLAGKVQDRATAILQQLGRRRRDGEGGEVVEIPEVGPKEEDSDAVPAGDGPARRNPRERRDPAERRSGAERSGSG